VKQPSVPFPDPRALLRR